MARTSGGKAPSRMSGPLLLWLVIGCRGDRVGVAKNLGTDPVSGLLAFGDKSWQKPDRNAGSVPVFRLASA